MSDQNQKVFDISIEDPSREFDRHLSIHDNNRIIFSGIFGIGKTHFLEKYFSKLEDQYLVVKLAPVNYSISSNEDIFQLIKYDILYEIIVTHEYKFEKLNFSKALTYSTLISNSFSKTPLFIEKFISYIPLLNKMGVEDIETLTYPIKNIIELFNSLTTLSKEADQLNKNGDFINIKKFFNEYGNKFQIEFDFISQFIYETLEILSEKEGKVKSKVLVIDDLDRIDPEHIFRLFNIFSSHIDYKKTTDNKFGFDKIIFVCDINNIRNIFLTRYGAQTDFSGYIDKFYSNEIFHFDNSTAIKNSIRYILNSIKLDNNYEHIHELIFSKALDTILIVMIYSSAINLRNLKRIYNSKYYFKERQIPLKGFRHKKKNYRIPITLIYEVLEWIFGDKKFLLNALTKVKNLAATHEFIIDTQDLNFRYYIGEIVIFLDARRHKFFENNNNNANYHVYQQDGITINYNLRNANQTNSNYYAEVSLIESNNSSSDAAVYFELLLKGYEEYINIK